MLRLQISLVSAQKRNRLLLISLDELAKDVEKAPDSCQYERAARFKVSANRIWRALKRLSVPYKKNPQASQSGSRKTICVLLKNGLISGKNTPRRLY